MRGAMSSYNQSHSYARSKQFHLPDIKKSSIASGGRRLFRRGNKSKRRRKGHSPVTQQDSLTTQRHSNQHRRPQKVKNERKSSYIELLKSMQLAETRYGHEKMKKDTRGFRVMKMKKNKKKKCSSRFTGPPEHRDHFRFMQRLQKLRFEDKRRHKEKMLKKKLKRNMQNKELKMQRAIEFLREIYRHADYSIREPSPTVEYEKSDVGNAPLSRRDAQCDEENKKHTTKKKKKKNKQKKRAKKHESIVEMEQKEGKSKSNGLCTTTELILNASNVSHHSNAYPIGSMISSSPKECRKPLLSCSSTLLCREETDGDVEEKDNKETILGDENRASALIKRAIQTPGFGGSRGPLDFSPSPWTPAHGGTQGFGTIQWSRGSQGLGL